MELSYLATWYIIGLFISFLVFMLYVVKDISELKNDRNFIIIFSLSSWLTVLLQIAFIIKELKDNRK